MKRSMRTRAVGWVLAVVVLCSIVAAHESETLLPAARTSVTEDGRRAEEVTAWSVDSGGGESNGENFSLTAAIGQPDAGQLSQGNTVLDGGLWVGAVDLQVIFNDGFETGDTSGWSTVVGGTK